MFSQWHDSSAAGHRGGPDLETQREQLLAKARKMTEVAKSANRDLTESEAQERDSYLKHAEECAAQAGRARKSRDLVERLAAPEGAEAGAPASDRVGPEASGRKTGRSSAWAKSAVQTLGRGARDAGVKSLLSGLVSTEPIAGVGELGSAPTTLLDLIPRESHDRHEIAYLRQVVRDSAAAVVPDGGLKPTSNYEFSEVRDHCRVIAHLAGPMPLRYLSDYGTLTQVLESQMCQGILEELERQVVSGSGTDDEFSGLLTTTGATDVPFDTDALTTVRKARTVLANAGEVPTGWVLHPSDMEALELMREDGASGGFLMDGGAYDTLFGPGIARVQSFAVPQGTAILADWSTLRLLVREGEHTLAATQAGDLFQRNQVLIRAEGRYGLVYWRPSAIAVVHLTAGESA